MSSFLLYICHLFIYISDEMTEVILKGNQNPAYYVFVNYDQGETHIEIGVI